MANTTINGVILHNGTNAVITDSSASKTSSLTVMPLYLSDSDETNVFDFGGVVKTLTITGEYLADTVADLKTWIDSIEGLQQGHQDVGAGAPWTFVDDLRAPSPGIKVKVMDFNSTQIQAEPTRVNWTIKIVEASIAA